MFTKIDQKLDYKVSMNKFKRVTMLYIFSGYNEIKLEVNNKKDN